MTQSVGNFPFPRSSFEWPVTPPDSEADEGAIAVVCFSYAWLPYVLGALKQLLLQSTWDGDDDTVELALGRATDLIAQFDSPSASCPEIMVLRGVRYNSETDTIQTDFGGTGTWVDAPELDPRHSPLMQLPLLTTSDPRCDAAANMRVNLKAFVDAGIRYAELATLTASLIDALLLFIPGIPTLLEIVLAGAAALLTAGADALADNFTTDVYDDIQCIFYCHTAPDGSVAADQLENIRADIQARHLGIVYDVCLAYLLITGEVGLTNAGASGSETGDCSACACCPDGADWCVDIFTADSTFDGDFAPDNGDHSWTGNFGAYLNDTMSPPPDNYAWAASTLTRGATPEVVVAMNIFRTFPSGTYTSIDFDWAITYGSFTVDIRGFSVVFDGVTILSSAVDASGHFHADILVTGTPLMTVNTIASYHNDGGAGGGGALIQNLKLAGTGTEPSF